MTKSLILLIAAAAVVALIAPGAKAQLNASKAFATAPGSVFPLLNESTRLDMIDYYNSNLSTPSANRFDGKSRISAMNDKMVSVELTPSSTCDLFIMPAAAGDSIIGIINTMATPTPDSHLSLFSRDWKQLDTSRYFTKPVLADWLTPDGVKNRAEVESLVPFLLISYTWEPAENVLTLTNNTRLFLSDDVYSIIAGYMRPRLVYRWDGRKFNLEKQED